jgi:hypothetical protein
LRLILFEIFKLTRKLLFINLHINFFVSSPSIKTFRARRSGARIRQYA